MSSSPNKVGWEGWFDAISLMLVWLLLAATCDGCVERITRNEIVYVCGYEYHARNCDRLKRCNDTIVTMKLHEAKEKGIEPCYKCAN